MGFYSFTDLGDDLNHSKDDTTYDDIDTDVTHDDSLPVRLEDMLQHVGEIFEVVKGRIFILRLISRRDCVLRDLGFRIPRNHAVLQRSRPVA